MDGILLVDQREDGVVQVLILRVLGDPLATYNEMAFASTLFVFCGCVESYPGEFIGFKKLGLGTCLGFI